MHSWLLLHEFFEAGVIGIGFNVGNSIDKIPDNGAAPSANEEKSQIYQSERWKFFFKKDLTNILGQIVPRKRNKNLQRHWINTEYKRKPTKEGEESSPNENIDNICGAERWHKKYSKWKESQTGSTKTRNKLKSFLSIS